MKSKERLPGSAGEHILQERYGTSKRACEFYDRQLLAYVNPSMRQFIERQEMVFIATADANGEADCSFRAGLPGFVHVLGDKELMYPEYRGNGVLASLGNLSENPHIGMMFVDFFQDSIGLHVNGTARIIENSELLRRADVPDAVRNELAVRGGRKPERWVLVHVEEAYIHCSKHIPRLAKGKKSIHWGSDDVRVKGGDYFHVEAEPKP